MGVPCHVNTAIDVTLGMLSHSFIPPPPAPPVKVPAVPSVEMAATQMWTLGFLCGQNKFTTTVLHYGLPLIQEGHDQGMMIPDITIPFVNVWYAVMWPFSSRKVMFFSSLVHYDKKGAGCSAIFIPFPMQTCGEPVSAPTAFPVTNLLNTVIVSLSPGDIIAGVGRIAFSMALDLIFSGGGGGGGKGSAWSQVGQEFLNKLCPTDPAGWAKLALSGLSGVLYPSPTEGPKFEMKIGLPGVAEAGVSISGSEASVGANLFGGPDNQGGFGLGGSTGVKYGDDQGTRGFAAGTAGDSKGEVSTADSPSSGSGSGAKGGGGGGGTPGTGSGTSGDSGGTTLGGGSQSSGGSSQSTGTKGTGGDSKSTGGSGSQSTGSGTSGAGGTTLGGSDSQSESSGTKDTTGTSGGSQSPNKDAKDPGGSGSQSTGSGTSGAGGTTLGGSDSQSESSGTKETTGTSGGTQSPNKDAKDPGGSGSQSSGGGSKSSGTMGSAGETDGEEEELQM